MRRIKPWLYGVLVMACIGSAAGTEADDKVSFFDPDDGMLDLSEYLATASGFLPVPIIITEPVVMAIRYSVALTDNEALRLT